jgi:DNA-binding response OmpR family regulator
MGTKSQSKATVMVVDDNPEILSMVTLRLEKRGYRVIAAEDGEVALDIVGTEKPDVVILDVMMPKKNGWEVARAMRQNPATKDIKILILTAIGESINELTSPLYGADAHLDKPFDFDDLEKLVAKLCVS